MTETKYQQDTLVSPDEVAPERPDGACVRWAECGNFPPGHPESNNRICDECLDALRAEGRGHPI
jgi:hypothetical protein